MHRERHITDFHCITHSASASHSLSTLRICGTYLALPMPSAPAAAARHAAPRVPARSGGAAALSSSAGSTEHTPSQREARTAQLARVDDRPDPKRMRHCLTLTVSRSLSHEALSLMVKGMQGETGQHSATNMKQAASVKTPPK